MIYQGDALQYILETPQILGRIMEHKDEVLRASRNKLKGRQISEVYLTGSGSSYNSAAAAAVFAKRILGIRVTPAYPAALRQELAVLSEQAVVLGISQQGTSSEVIRTLDAVREKNITAISMTGEYDTEITRHSDANIYVECGKEDAGATTKGYTATVLTLLLFVLDLAKGMRNISQSEETCYQARLNRVINNMDTVLTDSRPWCGRVAREWKDSRELMIITGSNLQGILLEGVLKFSETCRFPVRGYEASEFMHGIYNTVTEEMDFLYVFTEAEEEARQMKRLKGYYDQKNNRQYAINLKRADNRGKDNILPCRFVNDPFFSELEYMLPLQMLFVMASRERGIDLNIPKDPDFHKYMGSKWE